MLSSDVSDNQTIRSDDRTIRSDNQADYQVDYQTIRLISDLIDNLVKESGS